MSITTSVGSLAYTSMDPSVPAGTIAALATIVPVRSFSVEASGRVCRVGQVVRKPTGAGSTAVKFSEYPCAAAGRLQALRTGNVRPCPPTSDGPPNAPVGLRVSAVRQGVMG